MTEPIEFNCVGEVKLVYNYAELEAQQMAMASRVIEHKVMQDQSPAKPASIQQLLESDGTFYKERCVSLLVLRFDNDISALKPFNKTVADSSFFNMLKGLKGEEVDKLDAVIADFFTKRGKISLISYLDSNVELRAMLPMAQNFMKMEQKKPEESATNSSESIAA